MKIIRQTKGTMNSMTAVSGSTAKPSSSTDSPVGIEKSGSSMGCS